VLNAGRIHTCCGRAEEDKNIPDEHARWIEPIILAGVERMQALEWCYLISSSMHGMVRLFDRCGYLRRKQTSRTREAIRKSSFRKHGKLLAGQVML
jgi:hypothetical protein